MKIKPRNEYKILFVAKLSRSYLSQGWSSSADPRKRDPSVLHMEAEGIKKEIGEHDERKKLEHLDLKSEVIESNSFHNFDMIVLMISNYH